jgi:DNA-directed RNA polymerase II subunit RPB1
MDTEIYTQDNNKIKMIDQIRFSIWGNDEILKYSTLDHNGDGIDIAESYDNLEPRKNGLIDPRLGTSSNDIDCATCGLSYKYCPGHFGHINLVEPVFHIGYLPFVKKVMNCICLKCSKLLIHKTPEEFMEIIKNKNNRERLNDMAELAKNISFCNIQNLGCGAPVAKIKHIVDKHTGNIIIYKEFSSQEESNEADVDEKKKERLTLTPETCYNILSNISDDDCKILGFDPEIMRPEMMIHKIFPVSPVPMRPSSRSDQLSSMTIIDDLTLSLASIVKSTVRIRQQKEKMTEEQEEKRHKENIGLTQYNIVVYFDNENSLLPKSEQKGRPIKSLSQRLKGKDGRIRFNLMGKRVDFSARTVITPDPTLDLNQLGVPLRIAMTLTFPEIVTPNNIEFLSKLVRNGRDVYPGANFVIPMSNMRRGEQISRIDLRYRKSKIDLRYGDIVERHLLDNDMVLLNRQPSLHKQSMMGHRIKILGNPQLSSFRISLAITIPYAADFDGDEMNIFVPQNITTQIELEELADAKIQIISPQTSTPVYGAKQDALIGSYIMTQKDTKINWKIFMNLLVGVDFNEFPKIQKNKEYTGQELASFIIPKRINVHTYDDTGKTKLFIKNGELIEGILSKTEIGNKKKNSLQQLILDEFGFDQATHFLNTIIKVMDKFNMYHGATIHLGDLIESDDIKEQIRKIIETTELKIKCAITDLENNPNSVDYEIFEIKNFAEMDNILSDVSNLIIKNMDKKNNLNMLASSGAKGDKTNIGQLNGCVGMQSIEGMAIKKDFNERSLPYFHKNDDSLLARGFVKHSFMDGLNFPEFFIGLKAARNGLIDTAIKTADTGYIEHKIIKIMEDVMIKYDSSVRGALNQIIQFNYCDTGADTTKQYEYNLKFLNLGDNDIRAKYIFSTDELKDINYSNEENENFYNKLLKFRNKLRKTQYKSHLDNQILTTAFLLPVNINRIIQNAIHYNSEIEKDSILEPKYILERIKNVLSHENMQLGCVKMGDIKKYDNKVAKTSLKICLYECFAPKKCIINHKLSKKSFDEAIKEIKNNFDKNMIEPGEMVGVVAAQSMGEGLTQTTISSFHSAGVAAKGTSVIGVKRLKELLSLTTKMKKPWIYAQLNDTISENKEIANKIAAHIRYVTFSDIVNKIEVFYDSKPRKKNGIAEQDHIENIFHTMGEKTNKNIDELPWFIRIELNREKLLEKEITLLDIKNKFCKTWEKQIYNKKTLKKEEKKVIEKVSSCAILSNTDNDDIPIIHIRFNIQDCSMEVIYGFIDFVLKRFRIRGISEENIESDISEQNQYVFDENNKLISKKKFLINIFGSNIYDIRYIEGINQYKTTTNDIMVIYNTFGVEACRTPLVRELMGIWANVGLPINSNHLGLLVDLMLFTGKPLSVDRHGISHTDNETLSRASFEKTVSVLIAAAVSGEVDHINSVSARIMTGQTIKGGTGLCNIYLDDELLTKSEYIGESFGERVNILKKNVVIDDILLKKESNIFIP